MATVPWTKKPYPETRRTDHVEIYKSAAKGETKVSDPYVWLEETTPETEEWVSQQEAFTRQYLDQLPDRERLEKAIRANMDYPKFSAPGLRGDHWYWYYNSGLQAQSIIYRSSTTELPQFFGQKDDGPGGEVFFDVNLLSEDGTAALATSSFSRCGKYFAYGISRSGSDFCTIYIRTTDAPLAQAGEERPSHDDNRLSDELRYVKFSSISWTADSKGFFYQRFPARSEHGEASSDKAGTETNVDLNAALYYHRVGTPQSEDVLVMEDPEHPHYMWHVSISETEEGRWAYLSISRDTMRRNPLWVADLTKCEISRDMPWVKLVDNFDADWHCVTQHGTKMILSTNKDAPRHKLVSVDIAHEPFVFTDLVPEDPDGALLKSAQAVQDNKMMIVYQRNVMDELYVYSQDGTRLTRLGTEFVGSLSVTGKQTEHKKVFVTMAGFTTPGTVALYDLELPENERKMVDWRTTVLHGLNPTEFSAEQVWYPSKDGTKIPMFIVKHSSTVFDGTAPAIQYGYGGFDISITPNFSPSVLTWLKAYGGVYVVANIRGGGEFGDDWHHGGMREKKHNCFDDFIAATQYLEDHKYVGKGRVAINGGSNGGLLVAASVFRAPEGTFGAAVAEVGVHDFLKFHRFTIGRAWTADYGNPDDPTDFDFMYPISPVHNVPTNKVLPPMMLHTADHDDRVVPLHSFKLAAALQHAAPENENPLLLRIEKKAGHGAGKSTEQRVKEAADKWAFVANAMGCKWRDD